MPEQLLQPWPGLGRAGVRQRQPRLLPLSLATTTTLPDGGPHFLELYISLTHGA